MTSKYEKLRVLVVDDFNNFRLTLNKIMYELGFRSLDSVNTGEEALNHCRKKHYDIILCDYNLGAGKNGQQLLEELRIAQLMQQGDIFILLSAETSRNIVMSAYDCEPDAYLTKPITTKVIQQRLKRLLAKRAELSFVYDALEQNDSEKAISLLTRQINNNTRHSMDCQKLLAEIYIAHQQLDEAELLYRSVLEMRALNWAQLGLAQIKAIRGDTETAQLWLNDIIAENPSYMPAYDALSEVFSQSNDKENLQKILEKAVEVSPLSIGRQVYLAKTALDNGDAEVAALAYRKTAKYGENSCHNTLENQLGFAKAVSRCFDSDINKAKTMAKEAAKILDSLTDDELKTDAHLKTQAQLLGSQLWAIQGHAEKSKKLFDEVQQNIASDELAEIELEIELVHALITLNDDMGAQKKLDAMVAYYQDDQAALELIDPLLAEPVSDKGKQALAGINKNGINAYKAAKYDQAINFFIKAEKRYPRYVGIKLNLVQALIGKMRTEGRDQEDINRCLNIFTVVKRYIHAGSNHFNRYEQLQGMLRELSQTPKR
ncbi:MAG: response regulator [Cellvibrionaceae bacterium]|nr:response regulator [Cellvibrionaceae bacterium]